MARVSALSAFRGPAGLYTAYLKLLFGVKCRASVGNRGGAPVSGMEKLLTRIKALFAPSAPPAPPQAVEVEVTATPPVTVPEPIETLPERPLAEEPLATVDEPSTRAAEAPTTLVEEAPADSEA